MDKEWLAKQAKIQYELYEKALKIGAHAKAAFHMNEYLNYDKASKQCGF